MERIEGAIEFKVARCLRMDVNELIEETVLMEDEDARLVKYVLALSFKLVLLPADSGSGLEKQKRSEMICGVWLARNPPATPIPIVNMPYNPPFDVP